MKLDMTINYHVEDTDPEVEEILEEAVAEEARGFVEAVRRRLTAAGVTDISMNLSEEAT
jgi:hypothetical protein